MRDQVDVRRDRAELDGGRLAPHTLHGVCRRGELPDLAAIEEQDDAHRLRCHRMFLLASLRLHTPPGALLESAFRHGRLCQEAPGDFTITQEDTVALDSGTSGERKGLVRYMDGMTLSIPEMRRLPHDSWEGPEPESEPTRSDT